MFHILCITHRHRAAYVSDIGWDTLIPLAYIATINNRIMENPAITHRHSCLNARLIFAENRLRFRTNNSCTRLAIIIWKSSKNGANLISLLAQFMAFSFANYPWVSDLRTSNKCIETAPIELLKLMYFQLEGQWLDLHKEMEIGEDNQSA